MFLNLKGGKNISLGKNVRLGSFGTLHALTSYRRSCYSPKIEFEEDVSIGDNFHISIIDSLTIQSGTLIGYNLTIVDNSHGNVYSINEENVIPPAQRTLESKGTVRIGTNVWIGDKVTILPGVVIGNNSIIGSNTVVTKSFEGGSVIVGVPGKKIN